MKKLLVLFFVVATTLSYAQESVLLRAKYEKGDVYQMVMTQSMSSPGGVSDTEMTMSMKILDAAEGVYTSEYKFLAVKLNGMQGGMPLSFDSTKKDEELDQMGMMLKGQFAPLLKMVITGKSNELNKNLEVKIEPANPLMEEQFKTQSMTYPEKAVKVGDSWTENTEQQGLKMATEYKVKEITEDKVILSVSGTASGVGEGTTTGSVEIDRKTGLTTNSNVVTDVKASGQAMKIGIKVSMKKMLL